MLFFFFQKLMSFLKARKSKRSCRGERAGACAWAPEPAGPPRHGVRLGLGEEKGRGRRGRLQPPLPAGPAAPAPRGKGTCSF